VEVGVPNAIGRRKILGTTQFTCFTGTKVQKTDEKGAALPDVLLGKLPSQVSEEDRQAVASRLHGCVGADIKLVVASGLTLR
jgi:transposase